MKHIEFVHDLVSVIVPVYNCEQYLPWCIDSIINQSYKNIEIILVTGASTDNSSEMCDKYALNDNRIKVIPEKNSGPAAARNTGIENSKGEFILFVDADDFIENDTLEIFVAKYNQYHPDLVMANFGKLENNGEMLKQNVLFRPDDVPFTHEIKVLSKADIVDYVRHFLKHPSNHLVSYCWGRLYKSSIIKNNGIFSNEDMRLFEDFVFNLEYLKHTNELIFVNESLYIYTMHSNHISASMAIVNGDSLLHDMKVFDVKTNEFLQQNANAMNTFEIKKEIGHALVHYVIIFLVRSCMQITKQNKKRIYDEIDKIINAPIFIDSLQYYSPSKGNSRILPFLMKLKLVNLIMFVCRYKAYKRYGKLKSE